MSTGEIRVLLVEDDDDMRVTLSDFISRMGVVVRTAGDVSNALRIIRSETVPFSLVLTDLKLPGGTGLDVVRAARARSSESLVTIVTGYASLETAIEAIRLGAYDYITKPFSLDEIGVQVRNMIERVSLSRENARLSLRLQELYDQLNRLQAERVEMLKFQEQILAALRQATGKLDQLLSNQEKRPPNADQHPAKGAITGLYRELEKLDRMKGSSTISLLELEEQKRHLIDGFVGSL